MKVLVTGGAGFIGSNIVRALVDRGERVRVLDNFVTGKRENLAADIEVLEGDIRNPEVCLDACRGVDAVLHQAALGSVPRSVEDPVFSHQVNVDGTLNLLVAARERGIGRLVTASSSSVYGDAPEKVKTETLPVRPLSPYAVSKYAAEAYTLVFHKVYGLETVALRYFNVFGPRQDPQSIYAAVVPRFAEALLTGSRPTIYGDGRQTRDFTYVDNVVQANLLALECGPQALGRAYNIAGGTSTSVLELLRLLAAAAGRDGEAELDFQDSRPGDVRHSLSSIEAARENLGYSPVVSVREGIIRTFDWYRSRANSAAR